MRGQGRVDRHRVPEEDRRRPVRRRGLHHAAADRATVCASSMPAACSHAMDLRPAKRCASTPAASSRWCRRVQLRHPVRRQGEDGAVRRRGPVLRDADRAGPGLAAVAAAVSRLADRITKAMPGIGRGRQGRGLGPRVRPRQSHRRRRLGRIRVRPAVRATADSRQADVRSPDVPFGIFTRNEFVTSHGTSVHLHDEGADEGLSARPRRAQGHLAVVPAGRQDRRARLQRRRQEHAAAHHGGRRDASSSARPSSRRAARSATCRRSRSSIPRRPCSATSRKASQTVRGPARALRRDQREVRRGPVARRDGQGARRAGPRSRTRSTRSTPGTSTARSSWRWTRCACRRPMPTSRRCRGGEKRRVALCRLLLQ